MEKLKPNFSCRKRNFYFRGLTVVSRGLKVVQPRPKAEAGHSDQGWTFRPRLAVRPRKWKCLLRHEKLCWRFSMSRTKLKIGPRILFFWRRGLDLRLSLNLSLWSELQHCKSSLKVSRSSTENSRPAFSRIKDQRSKLTSEAALLYSLNKNY